MANNTDNYVFSQIVQKPEDPFQLLAYAIYKSDKYAAAERIKKANPQMTQQELQDQLDQIHDVVADNVGIQKGFHMRAELVGRQLVRNIRAKLQKDAVQDFVDRMEQLTKTERTLWMRIFSFIGDGVKGVLATIVLIVFGSGLFALTLPQEQRGLAYKAGADAFMDTVNGNIPIIDQYRKSLSELQTLKAQKEKEVQELKALQQQKQQLHSQPSQ